MARLGKGRIKELLPVAGKPMIDYSVQEALQAGVKEILVVLNPAKREIQRYLLGEGSNAVFTFVYQPEPCGLADALHRCMDHTGDQPFAVLLPDTVFSSDTPAIAQLGQVFEEYGSSLIGCIRVSKEKAPLFGNCGRIEEYRRVSDRVIEVARLQDKEPGEFSTLGEHEVLRTFARYIYLPDVFDYIVRFRDATPGELDDVPVLQQMVRQKKLLSVLLEGEGYDLGNPRGYEYVEELGWPS